MIGNFLVCILICGIKQSPFDRFDLRDVHLMWALDFSYELNIVFKVSYKQK